jgi:hypothetical protein
MGTGEFSSSRSILDDGMTSGLPVIKVIAGGAASEVRRT